MTGDYKLLIFCRSLVFKIFYKSQNSRYVRSPMKSFPNLNSKDVILIFKFCNDVMDGSTRDTCVAGYHRDCFPHF